jgi:hypothetical protein
LSLYIHIRSKGIMRTQTMRDLAAWTDEWK